MKQNYVLISRNSKKDKSTVGLNNHIGNRDVARISERGIEPWSQAKRVTYDGFYSLLSHQFEAEVANTYVCIDWGMVSVISPHGPLIGKQPAPHCCPTCIFTTVSHSDAGMSICMLLCVEAS